MQIPISEIPNTQKLIKDFLNGTESTRPFYNKPFSLENIQQQSREKLSTYSHRADLCKVLEAQMKELDLSEKQLENLKKLNQKNTCTVTTGHQLNLYTGPLYFMYKILQTAKCASELNSKITDYHYVPIFWMASEDHDFEEINHCFVNHTQIHWHTEQKGAVGRFELSGIESVKEQLFQVLGKQPYSAKIQEIIDSSYQANETLSRATRKLVHALCKDFGILILDADDSKLKKLFSSNIKEELTNSALQKSTQPTLKNLDSKGYHIQANPRDINLFYFSKWGRNRIEGYNDLFQIVNTPLQFTEKEIVQELENHPENFSPNALMRPLYQECILPNVCYIGGAGEIAYWLELKAYFECQKIPFPILQVRNSFLWLNTKEQRRLKALGLSEKDLVQAQSVLEKKVVQNFSMVDLEMDLYRKQIQNIYSELIEKSKQTDITLQNLLKAQEKKQLNAFDALDKRLVRAEKKVLSDKMESLRKLYEDLYPEGVFQERKNNVLEYYQHLGPDFLVKVYKAISYEESLLNIHNL